MLIFQGCQMTDKDRIKNELTIDQVFSLVAELGGDPRMGADGEHFISRTICHGGQSHKLYYWNNTHLFRCFTECSPEIFDIYELVRKVNARQNSEWTLPHAINYVASYFGLAILESNFENEQNILQDWQILNKYNKISSVENNKKQRVEMKIYDILLEEIMTDNEKYLLESEDGYNYWEEHIKHVVNESVKSEMLCIK